MVWLGSGSALFSLAAQLPCRVRSILPSLAARPLAAARRQHKTCQVRPSGITALLCPAARHWLPEEHQLCLLLANVPARSGGLDLDEL